MPATNDYPDLPNLPATPSTIAQEPRSPDKHSALWQAFKAVRRATEKVKQAEPEWQQLEKALREVLVDRPVVTAKQVSPAKDTLIALVESVPVENFGTEMGRGEERFRDRLLAALRAT